VFATKSGALGRFPPQQMANAQNKCAGHDWRRSGDRQPRRAVVVTRRKAQAIRIAAALAISCSSAYALGRDRIFLFFFPPIFVHLTPS